MVGAFLPDYLAQDRGLGVGGATLVLVAFSLGAGAGTIGGGFLGQRVLARAPAAVGRLTGTAVALSCPLLLLLLHLARPATPASLLVPVALFAGAAAAGANPSIKAVLMNANPPHLRELALALHSTVDDVGKGLGPALLGPLVSALGRGTAFSIACLCWMPCAAMLLALGRTYRRDETAWRTQEGGQVNQEGGRRKAVAEGDERDDADSELAHILP